MFSLRLHLRGIIHRLDIAWLASIGPFSSEGCHDGVPRLIIFLRNAVATTDGAFEPMPAQQGPRGVLPEGFRLNPVATRVLPHRIVATQGLPREGESVKQ